MTTNATDEINTSLGFGADIKDTGIGRLCFFCSDVLPVFQ